MNKTFSRYAVAIGGGIAAVIILLFYYDAFAEKEPALLMKALSDAFLAPAAAYLAFTALCAIAKTGVFDILFYSTRNFFRLFRKNMEDPSLPRDFYEYYSERRKKPFDKWYLLFTGLAFLVFSIVFSILYSLV